MGARANAVVTVEEGDAPLFLRIARAVSDDVCRGRLRAGEALPGTRALAEALGVNRNTVVAAYRELVAEGWAVARTGGGTFVADVPEPRPRAFARRAPRPSSVARAPAFPLRADPAPAPGPAHAPSLPRGCLALGSGVPDVRLVPAALVARALRRALTARDAASALGYGDPRGDARLRAAVADLARTARGVPATADDVVITAGSGMALDLVARGVLRGGGTVAVEAVGYPPAWATFARAGQRVVPIPVDAQGLDVDALAQACDRGPIDAVYVTPHHHYPTTVTLSPGRRLALLDLARRSRFAVVEDDYDHELHYEGRPVLPLASADLHGSVIYVGTLSKVLAPGLRLGYLVAPPAVVERVARERYFVDRNGAQVVERAAAELLEDGTVARHVRRARRIYVARRDLLIERLAATFGTAVRVRPPAGGLAVWARFAVRAREMIAWERRALERGVAFVAGARYAFDGAAVPCARFGFASLDESELREAVRRLALSRRRSAFSAEA